MRRVAPDERERHPAARKDKRRWCGGHIGREHQVAIVVPANHPGYQGICRAAPDWYMRVHAGRLRRRPWWCFHVHACTTCGKQLRPASADECPDRPKTAT